MSRRIKDILRNDAYFNTDPADPRNWGKRSYLVEVRSGHLRYVLPFVIIGIIEFVEECGWIQEPPGWP